MRMSFKDLLRQEERPVGIFINTGSPEMVEIAAQTGFQFIIVDNEHGSWSGERNGHLIRAAETFGAVPMVRVPGASAENDIKFALDCGAAGVVVPGIQTPEDARTALRHAMFHPLGTRGACPYVRANRYTGRSERYFEDSNRDVSVVMMIEGAEGVKNYEAILDVEGVDTVFFGPYDLSVSLGIPGQTDSPRVAGSIQNMIRMAKERGVFAGMLGIGAEDSNRWFDCGVDYIVGVGDMALFYRSCDEMMRGIRNVTAK